jgi:ubiquinone/menaquinone biosynthesis C-methylase UbiE
MESKETHDLLETLAPFYENIWAPIGMLISARMRYSSIMKEAAKFLNSNSVIDLGAGTGKLRDFLNVSNYIALDISSKFLKILKKKRKSVDAIRGDVSELPFKNESFEGVAMLFVLHLLKNKEEALREIRRILEKDGKLFLTSLCKGGILSNILSNWWSVNPLNEKEYDELLSKAGFEIISSRKAGVWYFMKCKKL